MKRGPLALLLAAAFPIAAWFIAGDAGFSRGMLLALAGLLCLTVLPSIALAGAVISAGGGRRAWAAWAAMALDAFWLAMVALAVARGGM